MSITRRTVAAATVAHAIVGFWIATAVPGPLLAADDVAYLGLARTLAGQGAVPLPPQPPYGFGYPALLAPGWLSGLDEPEMLTYGRALNAVLGALLVPALFHLTRRVLHAGPGPALGAAVAAASLPAALLHSSIIWTENLLPLLLVTGLAVLVWFGDRPAASRALVLVLVAMAQVATHPRTLPTALVLVTAAVLVAVRRGHRGVHRARIVGVIVAAAVALFLAIEWARAALQEAAFGSSGTYGAADLVERRGPDRLVEMAVHGLGASAYLVLATAGVAVVGGVVLWRAGVEGRAAVAMVGVTVGVAGWFLTGVDRADAWLHGRYVEAAAAPLVAAGVLGLVRVSRRALAMLGATVVVAGLVAAWAGPGDTWARPRSPVMMLGVEPSGAPFATERFEPGAAASVAIVVGLVVWAMARSVPRAQPVVMALILGVAAWSGVWTLDELHVGSVAGAVQRDLPDDITAVAIDPAVASSAKPTAVAVAWEVGFDRTSLEADAGVSHRLVTDDQRELGPGEIRLPGALLVPTG